MQTLVISGAGPGDVMFSSNRGSWNVSRALADCAAGKHKCYVLPIAGALEANSGIEVDEAKVAELCASPSLAEHPLIVAMEEGRAWIIDGHHRLRALVRVGATEFLAFVIEEKDEPAYRILYNGERAPPFPLP